METTVPCNVDEANKGVAGVCAYVPQVAGEDRLKVPGAVPWPCIREQGIQRLVGDGGAVSVSDSLSCHRPFPTADYGLRFPYKSLWPAASTDSTESPISHNYVAFKHFPDIRMFRSVLFGFQITCTALGQVE